MGPWLDSVTAWLTSNPQWLAAAVFIVACVECLASPTAHREAETAKAHRG